MTRTQRATAALGLAVMLALGMSPVASAAEDHVVRGRYLELVSVLPDGADRLSPGVTVDWRVGISAPRADGGSIERAVRVDGELARYLQVSVLSCAGPAAADCTDAPALVPPRSVSADEELDLGSQSADRQQWLLVQVSLPAAVPAAAQTLTGALRLIARGVGEELAVTPDGDSGGGRGATEASSGRPTEAAPADRPADELAPPGAQLPGTGAQPALLLLAAGSAALVGAALRLQRRTPRAAETDGRSRA